VEEAAMGVNREYKDSVFSLLFGNPDILRRLYGALEGVRLADDVPVTVNTLSDVIFQEQIKDLSFLIDRRLVTLIEHQSTPNPNMALRLLIYISRVYEKLFDRKTLYSSKRLKVPWPEFIVLYNGTAPYPDQQTLNLSDMFEDVACLKNNAGELPALELKVKVYNINQGHNQAIVEQCKELGWYSSFIAKVRELKAEAGDLEAAMKMAIEHCINHDILKEFLENHSSEVMNMLLTEWNTMEYGEVQREEGREEGREESRQKINMILELVKQGHTAEQIEAKLVALESNAG
jgi:hypothetical protein